MRFARIWFGLAFLYGMAVLIPAYFHTPVGSPAFYYGFVGAAGATQLLYALIATDPARYRPAMLVGVASKISFALPCLLLRAPGLLPAAIADLVLMAGFLAAFARTPRRT